MAQRIPKFLWDLLGMPRPTDANDGQLIGWDKTLNQHVYSGISTAMQAALDLKSPLAGPGSAQAFSVGALTATGNVVNSSGYVQTSGTGNGVSNNINGELRLGNNTTYQGRVAFDGATGSTTMYFDSTYDNAGAAMVFRLRTNNASPVTAMKLLGNGEVLIGATSSNAKGKLQVNDYIYSKYGFNMDTGAVFATNDVASKFFGLGYGGAGAANFGDVIVYDGKAGIVARFFGAGNTTIGGSGSAYAANFRLEVRDTFRIYDSSSSAYGVKFGFTSNIPTIQGYRESVGAVDLSLQSGGGNLLVASATVYGNVTAKVQVAGNVFVSAGNCFSKSTVSGTSAAPTDEAGLVAYYGGYQYPAGIYFKNSFASSLDQWLVFKTTITGVLTEVGGFSKTGKFLLGSTTERTVEAVVPMLQISAATASAGISAVRFTANGGPARLLLASSRGDEGTRTVAQSGDIAGNIVFVQDNGVGITSNIAAIQGVVDAAPSGALIPGRLALFTADANGNSLLRMQINSVGNVLVGTASDLLSARAQIMCASTTGNAIHARTSDYATGTAGSSLQIDFGVATGNTYTALKAFTTGGSVWGNLVMQYGGGFILAGLSTANAAGAKLQVADGITFPTTFSSSTDPNTIKGYKEGSFTATATGMTTSPTGTVSYVRGGNQVTMTIPTIVATSNATTFTLTGAPAEIRPAASRYVTVRVQNNAGTITFGLAVIGTDGVITLSNGAPEGTAFTAAGAKGIYVSTVSYNI